MDEATFLLGGGTPVGRLGFGAMRLCGPMFWGPPADRAAAVRVARRVVELGVTFIDTADAYGVGANEELLADALHPYPTDLVIATKAGQSRPAPSHWVPLGRPEYLRQQAELSLRRLRLDVIDLFYLHRVDPTVPLADQVGTLAQLHAEGKIKYAGLSEVSVDQLREAAAIMPIASVQSRYSVTDRRWEDVLQWCTAHRVSFVPWAPIGRDGYLGSAPKALVEVAGELAATPAQTALAWLLRHSPVAVPIPGTSSVEHLEENVAAAKLRLSDDQYQLLATTTEPGGPQP